MLKQNDEHPAVKVQRVLPGTSLWAELICYAESCSWIAGGHLAKMMTENRFEDWESVFAAVDSEGIAGFCTLLKTDYYPENRYSPWISTIFVDERCRGRRLSGVLIDTAAAFAEEQGFEKVYIPSDIVGLYEKYGFQKIDQLKNYGGDIDFIFARAAAGRI